MSDKTEQTTMANSNIINFDRDVVEKNPGDKGKTSYSKLGSQAWEDIDRPFLPMDMKVCDVMKQLGKGDFNASRENLSRYQFINNYSYMRTLFINNSMLPSLKQKKIEKKDKPQDKKKKGKKQSKYSLDDALKNTQTIKDAEAFLKSKGYILKKDEIKKLTTLKRIESFFESTKTLNTEDYCSNSPLLSDYIEFRIATLMRLMENSIQNPFELRDYEVVCSMERIFEEVKKIYDEESVAKDIDILEDFETVLNRLKKTIDFSVEKLMCEYPKFLFPSNLEKTIPKSSIIPYKSQKQLIETIYKNPKSLLLLRVAIGGGKTTTAGALASYVQSIRDIQRAKKEEVNAKLLFICSVEPVRIQVGRLGWNMNIPLAVATKDDKGSGVKMTMNYNCNRELKNIVIVLSDILSGIELLKDARRKKDNGENYDKYILFFDEPTVGADEEDHPITRRVPEVLLYAPETTILSSASLPPAEQISNLLLLYKNNYPDGHVIDIDSKEAKIGCEIVSDADFSFAPHTGVETKKNLEHCIERIHEQPFIGKLYTSNIVYDLYKSIIDECLEETLPNIKEYFSFTKNRSQSNIQSFAVELLNFMKDNCDDDDIKNICKPKRKHYFISELDIKQSQPKSNEKEESDSDSDFEWDRGDEKNEDTDHVDSDSNLMKYVARQGMSSIDPSELATTKSSRFTNGCLIATQTPIEFAKKMGKSLLSKLPNVSTMVNRYEESIKRYNKQIKSIENSNIQSRKKVSRGDEEEKGDRYFDGDIQDKKDRMIGDVPKPSLDFPEWAQINTIAHIIEYSDIPFDFIDKSKIRVPLIVEDIDIDVMNVPDWVILLLYSGVGIYKSPDEIITKKYVDTVLNLAEEGKLAFIISDGTINYGANYPFTHVVVDDSMTNHSINTLFQLLGRAGRVGKSYASFGHLGPKGLSKLQNYIHGTIDSGARKEAISLEKAVSNMFDTKQKIYEKKIKERELYDERVNQRKLLEQRRKEREDAKKARLVSMSQYNNKEGNPLEKGWRTHSFVNKRPFHDNKSRYTHSSSPASNWRTSTENRSSDIEKVKELIKNKKFIPPHLKKIALENGLL